MIVLFPRRDPPVNVGAQIEFWDIDLLDLPTI